LLAIDNRYYASQRYNTLTFSSHSCALRLHNLFSLLANYNLTSPTLKHETGNSLYIDNLKLRLTKIQPNTCPLNTHLVVIYKYGLYNLETVIYAIRLSDYQVKPAYHHHHLLLLLLLLLFLLALIHVMTVHRRKVSSLPLLNVLPGLSPFRLPVTGRTIFFYVVAMACFL
jgi:hypothetical protein